MDGETVRVDSFDEYFRNEAYPLHHGSYMF